MSAHQEASATRRWRSWSVDLACPHCAAGVSLPLAFGTTRLLCSTCTGALVVTSGFLRRRRVHAIDPPPEVAVGQGELIIGRRLDFAYSTRRFKVLIDGRRVDRLKELETVRFVLAPGRHTVAVSVEISKSRPLEVVVEPGGRVELACGMRTPLALGFLLSLVYPPRALAVVTHSRGAVS